MISFFCPYCKHVLKAADESAGQSIACEQCRLEIRVPQPAAPPTLVRPEESAAGDPWWKRILKRPSTHSR
ncbi:MAG TPA: hypothetical protein VF278_00615 [Pirellulales bacterium]